MKKVKIFNKINISDLAKRQQSQNMLAMRMQAYLSPKKAKDNVKSKQTKLISKIKNLKSNVLPAKPDFKREQFGMEDKFLKERNAFLSKLASE